MPMTTPPASSSAPAALPAAPPPFRAPVTHAFGDLVAAALALTHRRAVVLVLLVCCVALSAAAALRLRYIATPAGSYAAVFDTWRGRFCAPRECFAMRQP